MKKLTLEHLSPYIPYGLTYYPSEQSDLYHDAFADNSPWDYITALENNDEYALKLKNSHLIQNNPFLTIEDGEIFLGQFKSSLGFDVDDVYASEVRPILRPLSDLTKDELRMIISHIFRDTKMIRPKMESVKCDNGFISFYDLDTSHTYVAVKPGKDNLPVMNMSNSFDDYSIFFKLHVDMMGLLDDGLAINLNDLNK